MNIQQICFNTSADLSYHRLSIEPPMEPACLCDASLVRSIRERSAISQEHQEKTLSHHLSEKITDRSLGYFRSFLLLSQLNDFPGNKDMSKLQRKHGFMYSCMFPQLQDDRNQNDPNLDLLLALRIIPELVSG